MVKHWNLFIDSLMHPKKLAAYRILSIGKIIQYVFLLITILTIFSFLNFVTGISDDRYNLEGITSFVKDIQFLLYPFAFLLQYIMNTIMLFIFISLLAYFGLFVLNISNRRGEYRQIWRTASLAITWAIILTILCSYISIPKVLEWIIVSIIPIVYMIIASLKYPKKPKKIK